MKFEPNKKNLNFSISRRSFLKKNLSFFTSLSIPIFIPTKFLSINKDKKNVTRVFDINGFKQVLLPKGHGQLITIDKEYKARYPSRDQNMQFMAFFNEKDCLYIQTKDTVGYITDWEITKEQKLKLNFFGPEPDIVVKKLPPDPLAPIEEYKKWALLQSWAKLKPSIIEKCNIIATASTPDINHLRKTQFNFIKKFIPPTACWITQWMKYPFNTMYPDFQPKQPELFKIFLAELHELNSIPLPYINGFLWDINCLNPKYDETKTIKNIDGSTAFYSEKKKYLKFACIGNSYWRNLIVELRNKLIDINGKLSKGVYYDMLTASSPVLCYSNSHDHIPGDPLCWQNGVKDILKKTKGVIMTEGNVEIYIDLVDVFLMHLYTNEDNLFPIWNKVYGSVARSAGWIVPEKSDFQEFLNIIRKAKKYGVIANGSPWMSQKIQEKLLHPDFANIWVEFEGYICNTK